ncbi:MAG: hypothetical protein AMJ65_02115, partial [Phycisphaerae bacterium SG8_4]
MFRPLLVNWPTAPKSRGFFHSLSSIRNGRAESPDGDTIGRGRLGGAAQLYLIAYRQSTTNAMPTLRA